MAKNNNLKAYVRYDGTGRVIPGSLILNRFKPAVGNWKEINSTECCTDFLSKCIEFVVNTTDGVDFEFSFNTSLPINFTINWGDGTSHIDSGGGGFYTETHTYPGTDRQYFARVCFDDPTVVTNLDFPSGGATITSLTGLQNLVNIGDINVDFHSLTSLDVSNLTNLYLLDASDNDFPGTSTNSLSFVNLSGCASIDTLRLDDSDFSGGFPDISDLVVLSLIDVDQSNITGSIDISYSNSLQFVDLSGNPNLTYVTISDTQPILTLNISDCGLTQTAVDDILVALSNNGQPNGVVSLNSGTSATPGATGLAAKLLLEADGWIVNVN